MEFDAEIIEITTGEFQDNIVAIEPALVSLDQDPNNLDLITQIMRGLHSIKGGSGFLELTNISSLAHGMEDLLILVKTEGLMLNSDHIDALFSGFNELQEMIADPFSSNKKDISSIISNFDQLTGKTETPAQNSPDAKAPIEEASSEKAPENSNRLFFLITSEIHQETAIDNPHLFIVFLSSDQITESFNPQEWLIELQGFGYVHGHIAEQSEGIMVLLSTALAPSLLLQVSEVPISVSAVSSDLIGINANGDLKIQVAFNKTGPEILKPEESDSSTPIFDQAIAVEKEVSVQETEVKQSNEPAPQPEVVAPTQPLTETPQTVETVSSTASAPENVAQPVVTTPKPKKIVTRRSLDEINAEIANITLAKYKEHKDPDIKQIQQKLMAQGEKIPNVLEPVVSNQDNDGQQAVAPETVAVRTTPVPIVRASQTVVEKTPDLPQQVAADASVTTVPEETAIIATPTISEKVEESKPIEKEPQITAEAPTKELRKNEVEQAYKKSLQAPETQSASTVRVQVDRLDELVDLAGELVLARNQIMCFGKEIGSQAAGLDLVLRTLDRTTSKLQENIMTIRMQPIGNVFAKFPRMVRQIAKDLNKKIELNIESNDVDLDKSMIELLGDPMTHIVRNVVDHAIEIPEDRIAAGKPEMGLIKMRAYYEGGQAIIQITDDGKGIDPEIIVSIAIKKGVITEEECALLTPQNKIDLIFKSGFSTNEKTSMVSGRGVGMDVVRTNVHKIGGKVKVDSTIGEGTTLTIILPLTLAIMSALIVIDNQQRYAFPQPNVKEIALLKEEDIETIDGEKKQKMLKFRGSLLPLIALRSGLGLPKTPVELPEREEENPEQKIIIVQSGAHQVAIQVDEILGNEEIVVKPMPEYLKNLKNFSGITILGDGTISIIMDIMGFIEKNNLLDVSKIPEDATSNSKNLGQSQGTERLLLFHNGTEEIFAVFLPDISRVETIDPKKIQIINHEEYIECREEQTRILRLEKYLPVGSPENDPDEMRMIVPKVCSIPMGILMHDVLDTCEQFLSVETRHLPAEGVLGTALINDKITIILDLEELINQIVPKNNTGTVAPEIEEVTRPTRVLLAEDSPFFRLMEQRLIEAAGGEVIAVEDGKKALKLLQTDTFDLVLTDIEMPEMDGWGLIENIRSNPEWNELPVIALTSLNSDEVKERGIKAGFNDWLVKMERDHLIDALTTYI